MTKYKTYPSYKDSGVEWLGDVPSGWHNTRLGNISNITASGIDKKIIEN
jgi:type I restriction enzyme S subunit